MHVDDLSIKNGDYYGYVKLNNVDMKSGLGMGDTVCVCIYMEIHVYIYILICFKTYLSTILLVCIYIHTFVSVFI